jgi:thymidylate synthase (FAD)
MNIVTPKVYFLGHTRIRTDELVRYLKDTDQFEFFDEIDSAKSEGLSDSEILTSFYAKSCYSALTTKKNKNISKVRGISDNIKGTIKSGHGSVTEHCVVNFMISNCSRVMTHELVRHRSGCAFSQTSGRYVRTDILNIISDPILDPIKDLVVEAGLYLEDWYKRACDKIEINNVSDFDTKKKITSALRRILPNGQANEIGFSCNFRALRHIIVMRTSGHAEREIRDVFNQIYLMVRNEYPAMFFDAQEKDIDGLLEVTFQNNKI